MIKLEKILWKVDINYYSFQHQENLVTHIIMFWSTGQSGNPIFPNFDYFGIFSNFQIFCKCGILSEFFQIFCNAEFCLIQYFFHAVFCPFWILSHSSFFPFWILSSLGYCPFGNLSNAEYCPVEDFVHSEFCPFWISFVRDLVQFWILFILDFVHFGFVQRITLSSNSILKFRIIKFLTLKFLKNFSFRSMPCFWDSAVFLTVWNVN